MKLLLVTFPVDLGNATYEKKFVNFFSTCPEIDLQVFRFAPNPDIPHPRSIFTVDYLRLIFRRLKDSIELWQTIDRAKRSDRKILMMGVSPAMFGYFATGRKNSYIVTDWTRKLYEPIWKSSGSPAWLTQIHKHILNAQTSVLGLTKVVSEQIEKDYHVPSSNIKRAKVPFSVDLELFSPPIHREDNEVRLLFVGGDFQRKGGDVLLEWFKKNNRSELKMTMVTGFPLDDCPGLTIEKDVQYGQLKHINLFLSHDIFVLPTTCDGYPLVLGEAACAGLCILTTNKALGASEVIEHGKNGYIFDSQAELLECLTQLIEDREKIKLMKLNSRKCMETKFSKEKVINEYIDYIFK